MMFRREGWDWIHYEKEASVEKEDDTTSRVRLEYRSPAGVEGSCEAQVFVSCTVGTGGCGAEPHEAKQYGIRALSAT